MPPENLVSESRYFIKIIITVKYEPLSSTLRTVYYILTRSAKLYFEAPIKIIIYFLSLEWIKKISIT